MYPLLLRAARLRQSRRTVVLAILLVICAAAAPPNGAVATMFVSASTQSAAASGVLGSEFQISQSAMPYDAERPAIAYNSQHNEYLVVWRTAPSLLYGQRVSRTGALAGDAFPIYIGGQPALAYNAQDDQYLVVWSLNGPGGTALIAGRLLSWDGTLLGNAFTVWSWPNRTLTRPRAAWNSTGDEYFVIWQAQDSTTGAPTDIAGVHVHTDGSCDSTATLLATTNRPTTPDITYNPGPPSKFGVPGNEYYLVFTVDDYYADGVIYPSARDAIGGRLDANGAAIGVGRFLSERTSYIDNQEPAVATNQSTLYFTAWRHVDYTSYTAQIQAKVMNLYSSPTSGALPISPAIDVLSSGPPAIAGIAAPYDSRSNEFVVVWTMPTIAGRSIAGSRCTVDQSNLVSCEPFNVRADTGGGASFIARPTVAGGGRGYLLSYGAWPPGSGSGPQNVYGRLLRPALAYLPLLNR